MPYLFIYVCFFYFTCFTCFSGAFTSSGKVKYYENALELLVEATPIIKIISERDMKFYDIESEAKTDEEEYLKNFEKKEEGGSKSESENELNLLGYFEQRLQFILMSLTKLTMSKNENRRGCVLITRSVCAFFVDIYNMLSLFLFFF